VRRPAVRRSSCGLDDVLVECLRSDIGRVLRYVLLRDPLRNLSLEPSAGCRAVNHLGLTGSDPL
jgi:hypothetical protein